LKRAHTGPIRGTPKHSTVKSTRTIAGKGTHTIEDSFFAELSGKSWSSPSRLADDYNFPAATPSPEFRLARISRLTTRECCAPRFRRCGGGGARSRAYIEERRLAEFRSAVEPMLLAHGGRSGGNLDHDSGTRMNSAVGGTCQKPMFRRADHLVDLVVEQEVSEFGYPKDPVFSSRHDDNFARGKPAQAMARDRRVPRNYDAFMVANRSVRAFPSCTAETNPSPAWSHKQSGGHSVRGITSTVLRRTTTRRS